MRADTFGAFDRCRPKVISSTTTGIGRNTGEALAGGPPVDAFVAEDTTLGQSMGALKDLYSFRISL
jgi:hypothetical protein